LIGKELKKGLDPQGKKKGPDLSGPNMVIHSNSITCPVRSLYATTTVDELIVYSFHGKYAYENRFFQIFLLLVSQFPQNLRVLLQIIP
jgi:hypothetical protein